MVNKSELLDFVQAKFRWLNKPEEVKITIGKDGKVNVVEVHPGAGVLRCDEPLPDGKLPFEFGVFKASLVFDNCGLVTLVGCPEHVTGRFVTRRDHLVTLVGGPKRVGGRYWIQQDEPPLQSLDGFPDHVGEYAKLRYHPTLPLLRLVNCDDGAILSGPDAAITNKIEEILEKHKGRGRAGAWDFKEDLKKAGFAGNAKW